MRNVPLTAAFDLTQGELSIHHPNAPLTRSKTYPHHTMVQSSSRSKHRGVKDQLLPWARRGRAVDMGLALSVTSVDRCSTPISELYQAIDKICSEMDGCSRATAPYTAGVEEDPTPRGNWGSVAASPQPVIPYEARRSASATRGERAGTVIYETGPDPRLLDSVSAPCGGRGVTLVDTHPVAACGGARARTSALYHGGRPSSKQSHVVPQNCRGDELVLLCRVSPATDIPSQRSNPDPRSPLELPPTALPPHTRCSLARPDKERMKDTMPLRTYPIRSRFYGARQGSARAR